MTLRSAILSALLLAPFIYAGTAQAETIRVGDVDLEVEVKGQDSRVVLFEAGIPSGMAGWDAIWNLLPEDITAVRYSRRGEGASGACQGSMSAADYAQDTAQLLETLAITEPFVYVAHSYGGDIARAFAAQHPARVAAMLLLDPSNPRDVEIITELDPERGPAEIARIKQGDLEMSDDKWCFLEDFWQKHPSLGFDEIGDLPITLIAGTRRFEEPKLVFQSDRARERWGQIQAEWVEQFPRGRAIVSSLSSHFVHEDQPDLVLEELAKLLSYITR